MSVRSLLFVGAALLFCTGCTTYRVAKDVKIIGFEEDLRKGKSLGQLEASDCVYILFGRRLGGNPTLVRAIQNLRMGRDASIADVAGGSKGQFSELRYIKNLSAQPSGFDVSIFGKDCLTVTGLGYK